MLNEERQFLSWMRNTNQFFTGDEYHFRLGVFLSTARYVEEFNRKGASFKLGLNHLSHLTPSEYKSLLGAFVPDTEMRPTIENTNAAPESFDWREKGAVNAIKDQAQCGSCWAFSAIQTCESAYFIAKKTLLSLSESNLVDCVTSCYGCNGGWPYKAIDYVIKNQGGKFNSEEDYPYVAQTRKCAYNAAKAIGSVSGYKSIPKNEEQLKEAVYTYGPASICIDASCASFHSYSSGIYNEPKCSSLFLDHAVGCVGYGSENGKDYWIVRNSWGTSWGEQGYVRIARNAKNMCGVASSVIIATA